MTFVNLTDKHPAELDFQKMIKEVKSLLEKCENQFLDGDLKKELTAINKKLFDLQMERFTQYINDNGKVENMPMYEEAMQREMTDLTIRISKLLNTE
jgi:cob(I)alamin adenosyltransferase